MTRDEEVEKFDKLTRNIFIRILLSPIILSMEAMIRILPAYAVLDFNFIPPENRNAIKGRLITLLFTPENIRTPKGLIVLRQLYRADDANLFNEAGCYHFVVKKNLFRKATYELTRT